ncbi:GNAT family N-acetyltransferase [Marinifilum fragile]|uniref:GNAT family N-acetyltransferase n=1 Tax=Marinifilum fragile TaxID=570161 RepID=UPI002AAAE178|nr:GNAT family N-acetyltransferase [Marinifilum fragile]
MNINLTTISIDTIIQAFSIIAAALTFVIAQAFQKKKDRTQANRESYQQLEFASIDLFRFEAENIDLIRPIWEDDKEIPNQNTAEYVVLMNYVCQMLNLFEMALKFRRDKTLLPEVFGTWIAWFQLLICAPGFRIIWKDVRMDYLPELREIMDGGIEIVQKETNDDQIEAKFHQLVSSILKCDMISNWVESKIESKTASIRKKTVGKIPNDRLIDLGQLSCKWLNDLSETERLTTLFLNNSKNNYISHSEIQEGRAYNESTWSDDIRDILTTEFEEAIENGLFYNANIAALYHNNLLVAFALVEFKSSPNGNFAILSDIIVDKDYRNNKIGENLLRWIITQLSTNDIKCIYAESNIQNDIAHNFLLENGFKSISKVFKQDLIE